MIQLGNTIRTLRKYRGLKQAELADAADVSVSFLCHIEKNNREPSPALVRKLADALQIPIEFLIWDALEPPPNINEDEAKAFTIAKSIVQKYMSRLDDERNQTLS